MLPAFVRTWQMTRTADKTICQWSQTQGVGSGQATATLTDLAPGTGTDWVLILSTGSGLNQITMELDLVGTFDCNNGGTFAPNTTEFGTFTVKLTQCPSSSSASSSGQCCTTPCFDVQVFNDLKGQALGLQFVGDWQMRPVGPCKWQASKVSATSTLTVTLSTNLPSSQFGYTLIFKDSSNPSAGGTFIQELDYSVFPPQQLPFSCTTGGLFRNTDNNNPWMTFQVSPCPSSSSVSAVSATSAASLTSSLAACCPTDCFAFFFYDTYVYPVNQTGSSCGFDNPPDSGLFPPNVPHTQGSKGLNWFLHRTGPCTWSATYLNTTATLRILSPFGPSSPFILGSLLIRKGGYWWAASYGGPPPFGSFSCNGGGTTGFPANNCPGFPFNFVSFIATGIFLCPTSSSASSSSSSAAARVTTQCCPGGIPSILHATITNQGNCACLDGKVVFMQYIPALGLWQGVLDNICVGGTQQFFLQLDCPTPASACTGFRLKPTCTCGGAAFSPGLVNSCSCSPLSLTWNNVSLIGNPCCSGMIKIVITP
jgi:hypothetical protein